MEIKANRYGITERINEVIENLKELQDAKNDGVDTVDLSRVDFVKPFSLLPLAVFANNNGINITYSERKQDIRNYLNTVRFQTGVTELPGGTEKSYLPITKLSVCNENNILTEYEERILRNVNGGKNLSGLELSLKIFTGELESNVKQHSKADHYWLFAQYYGNQNRTCELVIADTGIGYRESYRNTMYEVKTDLEAIINAIEGKSRKHPEEKFEGMGTYYERGFGIRSILNLCVNGFGGKVVIMSGDYLVYYKPGEQRKEIPLKSYWNGSLIALNFNVKSLEPLKYTNIV